MRFGLAECGVGLDESARGLRELGSLPRGRVISTFELFTAEILPRFRREFGEPR